MKQLKLNGINPRKPGGTSEFKIQLYTICEPSDAGDTITAGGGGASSGNLGR